MPDTRGVLDLILKKPLHIGLLMASVVLLVSGSAIAMSGAVTERPLQVIGGNGSSISSTGLTITTILIEVMLAFVASAAVYGFLREARKHVGKGAETDDGSIVIPEKEHDWEEAPTEEHN